MRPSDFNPYGSSCAKDPASRSWGLEVVTL